MGTRTPDPQMSYRNISLKSLMLYRLSYAGPCINVFHIGISYFSPFLTIHKIMNVRNGWKYICQHYHL